MSSSPHGFPQVSTCVHCYLRNNVTYKSCCLIMRMINTIYFTYLSRAVCRDHYQHKNERKFSHDGHFIVFVLQNIIKIPVLAPNICMFHHITFLYESVPRHIHTIIIFLIVDNNILKWHKNTHQM